MIKRFICLQVMFIFLIRGKECDRNKLSTDEQNEDAIKVIIPTKKSNNQFFADDALIEAKILENKIAVEKALSDAVKYSSLDKQPFYDEFFLNCVRADRDPGFSQNIQINFSANENKLEQEQMSDNSTADNIISYGVVKPQFNRDEVLKLETMLDDTHNEEFNVDSIVGQFDSLLKLNFGLVSKNENIPQFNLVLSLSLSKKDEEIVRFTALTESMDPWKADQPFGQPKSTIQMPGHIILPIDMQKSQNSSVFILFDCKKSGTVVIHANLSQSDTSHQKGAPLLFSFVKICALDQQFPFLDMVVSEKQQYDREMQQGKDFVVLNSEVAQDTLALEYRTDEPALFLSLYAKEGSLNVQNDAFQTLCLDDSVSVSLKQRLSFGIVSDKFELPIIYDILLQCNDNAHQEPTIKTFIGKCQLNVNIPEALGEKQLVIDILKTCSKNEQIENEIAEIELPIIIGTDPSSMDVVNLGVTQEQYADFNKRMPLNESYVQYFIRAKGSLDSELLQIESYDVKVDSNLLQYDNIDEFDHEGKVFFQVLNVPKTFGVELKCLQTQKAANVEIVLNFKEKKSISFKFIKDCKQALIVSQYSYTQILYISAALIILFVFLNFLYAHMENHQKNQQKQYKVLSQGQSVYNENQQQQIEMSEVT